MQLCKIGTTCISTLVGDFEGNVNRIISAIKLAERQGVQILVTPELGVTGYSLGDRVLWDDIELKCEEAMRKIKEHCSKVTVFVGLPIFADGKIYNGMVCICGRKYCGGFLKAHLPSYNIFYETRNWSPYDGEDSIHHDLYGYLGHNIIEIGGVKIFGEICEDVWANSQTVSQAVSGENGAVLVVNGSASPFSPQKNVSRMKLIQTTAQKNICVYAYANQLGLDEGRTVFDGGGIIASPDGILSAGKILSDAAFTINTAVVDFDKIRRQRRENNTWKSIKSKHMSRIHSEYTKPILTNYQLIKEMLECDRYKEAHYSSAIDERQIFKALSLALRDYFIKAGCFNHILIGLSGGRDSALCLLAAHTAVHSMGKLPSEIIKTVYLDHSRNSSDRTKQAAIALAGALCIPIEVVNIDEASDISNTFAHDMLKKSSNLDNPPLDRITMQNTQARVRGAFMLNWANAIGGLVIVTANMSETAVGYCTTGGDNQGGYSLLTNVPKTMVNSILVDRTIVYKPMGNPISKAIREILNMKPSAELEPDQTDEDDLMPYQVLDNLLVLYIKERRPIIECLEILKVMYEVDFYIFGKLTKYCKRFIQMLVKNQWKRDQHPVGPRVMDFDLDPKTGFRFPVLQVLEEDLESLEGKL